MSSKSVMERHAASVGRKGLVIAIAASLVLIAFAAYKVPVFKNELQGTVVGVSLVLNRKEAGPKLIAAVQLDTGAQILVSMPDDFLMSESTSVTVNEERSLLGRRSYSIKRGR